MDFIKSILSLMYDMGNKKGAAKKAAPNEQLIWLKI